MKISFTNKIKENYHLVLIGPRIVNLNKNVHLDNNSLETINAFLKENKDSKEIIQTFYFSPSKKLKSLTLVQSNININSTEQQALGGRVLSYLERIKVADVSLSFLEIETAKQTNFIKSFTSGLFLKDYRFEKYKNFSKKDFKIKNLNLLNINQKINKGLVEDINNLNGIFLTRDLVSEPANILYPEKFVEFCDILKKSGVKIEVFDEKKLKSLKMNALLGVAQGSVRPARVMIMRWDGNKKSKNKPLAFIGKGVTFDTGGISIKPSSGMEDMKWDMGGAGVVAGLVYTLALRKAKVNVVGAVGLVENMPDGNAQRPGDVVKSMSGQTIEVLNTDAEGRLVLADVLWYIKERFKPSLMIDLATLTGAIIVALGERYAGLFSNDDSLAQKILNASTKTNELVWRMPMDSEFDKLLDCPVADMKNITGTRGAGSITAAQFLKRFVGNVSWAHLDIAGVTWSKKGTKFSRPGGTGFGVRLLDEFIKNNYEK